MSAFLLVTKFHVLNIPYLVDDTLTKIVDALENIQMA
jgi:hypothetical protein